MADCAQEDHGWPKGEEHWPALQPITSRNAQLVASRAALRAQPRPWLPTSSQLMRPPTSHDARDTRDSEGGAFWPRPTAGSHGDVGSGVWPRPTAGPHGEVGSGAWPEFRLNAKAAVCEGDCTEFKLSFHPQMGDVYRRVLNGFLNSKGGVLYFGIADDGTVRGVQCGGKRWPHGVTCHEAAIDRLKLWVDHTQNTLFVPAVSTISVRLYKLTPELAVWAIIVPPRRSPGPVYFKNTIFKRLNASTVIHCTQTVVTREQSDKMNSDLKRIGLELQRTKDDNTKFKGDMATLEKQLVSARGMLDNQVNQNRNLRESLDYQIRSNQTLRDQMVTAEAKVTELTHHAAEHQPLIAKLSEATTELLQQRDRCDKLAAQNLVLSGMVRDLVTLRTSSTRSAEKAPQTVATRATKPADGATVWGTVSRFFSCTSGSD